jgi:hypothetical protein
MWQVIAGVQMAKFKDPKFENINALKAAVEAAEGGVLVCHGGDLLHVAGKSKLKSNVRELIEKDMKREGLRAIPGIPEGQRDEVYVTRLQSEADRLFEAFHGPSERKLKRIQDATVGAGTATGTLANPAKRDEVLEMVEQLAITIRGLAASLEVV